MRLPAYCPKIRRGQIWEKLDGLAKGKQVEITGGQKGRKGQKYWHTRSVSNKNAKSHGMTEKTLWRFYKLVDHYVGQNGHAERENTGFLVGK